jgi:hypothetical protein
MGCVNEWMDDDATGFMDEWMWMDGDILMGG